jgi:hypothetical protein
MCALVPYGKTRRQIGTMIALAKKLDRFGPSLASDYQRQKSSETAKRWIREKGHPQARKTHCKRGHPLSGKNVYWATAKGATRKRRECRECWRVRGRDGRPSVVPVISNGSRIEINVARHDQFYRRERRKLVRRLADVHTDRGGGKTAALNASMALQRFDAREEKWYREVGLTPPKRKGKQREDRAA